MATWVVTPDGGNQRMILEKLTGHRDRRTGRDHYAARALGERLAAFRQAAGVTQGQLAKAVFCDRTTVVHIEKGRRL